MQKRWKLSSTQRAEVWSRWKAGQSLHAIGRWLGKDYLSFILKPKYGDDLKVNAWNWRPTVEFLRVEGIIDDNMAERMTCHGLYADVGVDLARCIGAAVARRLQSMRPGDRIRGDLSVTDAPKKLAEFHKPETIDEVDLYSANYEWLVEFKDFCESCGGFKV